MSNTILNVAMNGLLVGEWRKLTSGATEFQYAKKWLESVRSRPISLSLPLSYKTYRGDSVYNFFDNLLPDNEQIRSRIQQRFQTSTKSPFDLLSAIGQDCIGAIQLYQGENRSVRQIYAEPLNDKEVENVLKNYRTFPLGMEESEDFRISLAALRKKQRFFIIRINGSALYIPPRPVIFLSSRLVWLHKGNLIFPQL